MASFEEHGVMRMCIYCRWDSYGKIFCCMSSISNEAQTTVDYIVSWQYIKELKPPPYTMASQKHEITLLHMYILSKFLTADRSCTTKYYFENPFLNLVAHIFALLLAPFASNLGNYSRHSESLKNVQNWPNRWVFFKENFAEFEFFWKFKVSLCLE